MYLAPRWIDRNLSRLELIAAVMAIAALIGTFLHHALVVYSHAERTMLHTTVTNINTALRHRVMLSRLAHGGRVGIDFSRFNAMTEMSAEPLFPEATGARALTTASSIYAVIDVPPNYIGEFDEAPGEEVDKGVWYYVRDTRELIYTVINTEYFQTELPGQARIRFRLAVDYEDRNGNGEYDPASDLFHSVELRSPDIFEWKT